MTVVDVRGVNLPGCHPGHVAVTKTVGMPIKRARDRPCERGPGLFRLSGQWQFDPGEQGPHLLKSASHSGQSTGNPASARM